MNLAMKSSRGALLLVFCLVIGTLSGSGLATAQTNPVDFSDGTIVEQQGDVAVIPLSLKQTEQARLKISSSESDYSVSIQLTDVDDDGQITVLFDTARANTPQQAIRTSGDDKSTLISQRGIKEQILPTGRYNLIASSDSSYIANILWVDPPTLYGSSVSSYPSKISSTTIQQYQIMNSTSKGNNTSVASGDLAGVKFHLSGIGSAVQSENPGEQLVFATDSTPSAQTTHILQLSPDKQVADAQSVSVHYPGNNPALFKKTNPVRMIGIDTDSDGRVEEPLLGATTGYKTTSNGKISVYFDDPVSLNSTDTLMFEYAVKNPRTSGYETVNTHFGAYEQTGSIIYGPAGQGALGSGVDLRIQTTDGLVFSPLKLADIMYNSDTDALYAMIDTSKVPRGTHNVSLVVDNHVYSSKKVLTEHFTVVDPSVTDFSTEMTNGRLNVSAHTNIAPGSQVVVEVSSSSDSSYNAYLSQYSVVVQRDGTIRATIDVPQSVSGKLHVSIKHHNQELVSHELS